jgi:hypothetical protein
VSFRQLDVSGFLVPDQEPDRRRDLPERGGTGPLEASSCMVLAVTPEVIWDVNGYYRALGFEWPFTGITKKALRLAYHRVDGEKSVYLTRVFKLLLNEAERRKYDMAQFGHQHMDQIQIDALMDMVKRMAAAVKPSNDTRATQREILKQMGFNLPNTDSEHYPNEQYPDGQDPCKDEDLLIETFWRWGYYRWGTGCTEVTRLGHWQELLVSQLAALEVTTKICVGYIGRGRTDSRFVVARTYGVRTVYLREDMEPDREMATAAADALIADLTE